MVVGILTALTRYKQSFFITPTTIFGSRERIFFCYVSVTEGKFPEGQMLKLLEGRNPKRNQKISRQKN